MAFTLPWVGFQDSFFNTSLAHRAHLQFTLRLAFFKEFYSKIWELKSMNFFLLWKHWLFDFGSEILVKNECV